MARLLEPDPGMTIYDPACGSAGLLIKCQLRLIETHGERRNGRRRLPAELAPLSCFGQEINASTLFAKGRPKNYLTDEHVDRIARLYHEWSAEEGVSAVLTNAEAARNDDSLSPSRYVSSGEQAEVLPLEEAVVLLREAEEERAEADRELNRVLEALGLGGSHERA